MALIEQHILTASPYLITPDIRLITFSPADADLLVILPSAGQNPGRIITIRNRNADNLDFRFQEGDSYNGGEITEPAILPQDATNINWVTLMSDGISSWWAVDGAAFDND